MSKAEHLRRQIAQHREALDLLEEELKQVERQERDARWFPQGFYLAYYILSGMVLGLVAAWISLAINVAGAMLLGLDPLKLLRVYATIMGGEATATSKSAVIIVFATGLHSITGMICGTPIHVIYSRYFAGQSFGMRIVIGVLLGLLMWVVNFYGILSWLQPLLDGSSSSYIVATIPPWVAAGTHIVFTLTMVLMQPLAVFTPRNYPKTGTPFGKET